MDFALCKASDALSIVDEDSRMTNQSGLERKYRRTVAGFYVGASAVLCWMVCSRTTGSPSRTRRTPIRWCSAITIQRILFRPEFHTCTLVQGDAWKYFEYSDIGLTKHARSAISLHGNEEIQVTSITLSAHEIDNGMACYAGNKNTVQCALCYDG